MGDGEVFINGGRGDHSDSPIFNNRLHKEMINSWYVSTIITAATSQQSKSQTDYLQFHSYWIYLPGVQDSALEMASPLPSPK